MDWKLRWITWGVVLALSLALAFAPRAQGRAPDRPVPDVLEVGEHRIEGVVRERTEAVRSYAEARREGKTASLLEQERQNLFTVSDANVGPGEAEITIEYQQTLRYRDGASARRSTAPC